MVSGTPYIGPETDVWSLGVILYVLVSVCSLIHRMLTVDPKRCATLTDVLRPRRMRADGMVDTIMATALPALSAAPSTIRPPSTSSSTRTTTTTTTTTTNTTQAKSTALSTFHPNEDISKTMNNVPPPPPPHPPTTSTSTTPTTNGGNNGNGNGETVMITMCPSNDALNDSFDSSSKKKRKTLTKLRQFFRFETAAKC
ncbi:hypothetical protein BGX29_006286 [Mortierella sp. GBA35]|nr:hypothetical protein BGX29_006286 [Mortierella sp. GBA35]